MTDRTKKLIKQRGLKKVPKEETKSNQMDFAQKYLLAEAMTHTYRYNLTKDLGLEPNAHRVVGIVDDLLKSMFQAYVKNDPVEAAGFMGDHHALC